MRRRARGCWLHLASRVLIRTSCLPIQNPTPKKPSHERLTTTVPTACLQRRGGLVIQQLSQKLGGLRVYRELSRLLQVWTAWLAALAGTLVCMLTGPRTLWHTAALASRLFA